LRLFSFGGYGLALAALALVVFGVIECSPFKTIFLKIFFLQGEYFFKECISAKLCCFIFNFITV